MKNILITGAAGFVGKNLTAALETIRDGKDRTHPGVDIGELYLCDRDTDPRLFAEFCARADFVFHLAGVNRPQTPEEFWQGNTEFTARLIAELEAADNPCPVMHASSVQATLIGRYDSDYGRSKKAAEELFFAYGARTGAKTLVYRFPNLFGKWCRPNYNSVVATFCHHTAHGLPFTVDDRSTRLELLYIDDLVEELLAALVGGEHRCAFHGGAAVLCPEGEFCAAPITHSVTLGEIADLLERFRTQKTTLLMPEMPAGSFAKKLYATYLSYLPAGRVSYPLECKSDPRGSFTEFLRTEGCGQISINRIKPGESKGQHWHHTKWELFLVVSGRGRVEQRQIGSDEVLCFDLSGERPEVVQILPGYTHKLSNLSDTEDLITVMWANECFDPNRPDTFFEEV